MELGLRKILISYKQFIKGMSPTLLLKSFHELGIPDIYTMIFIIFILYLFLKNLENKKL